MKSELGSLLAHEKTGTSGVSVVDLPSTVNGRKRGSKIGQNTSHTEVDSLAWNCIEGERVLDSFLESLVSECI